MLALLSDGGSTSHIGSRPQCSDWDISTWNILLGQLQLCPLFETYSIELGPKSAKKWKSPKKRIQIDKKWNQIIFGESLPYKSGLGFFVPAREVLFLGGYLGTFGKIGHMGEFVVEGFLAPLAVLLE